MSGISHARAWVFLTLAPLLWSGNFIVGRAAHDALDPLALNFARWVVAALLLAPVLVTHRRAALLLLRGHARALVALAVLGVVGFNTVLYAGLGRIGAGEAGILFGITPVCVIVIARVWHGGCCPRRVWIGAALAVIGVGGVLWPTGGQAGFLAPGAALVLAAALIWAGYTVAVTRLAQAERPVIVLALTTWIGVVLMAPFAVMSDWPATPWPTALVGAVLYLGAGASVAAFWCWQLGTRVVGARRSGVFLNLIPVFGVLMGAIWLGESVSPAGLAALVLVLTGVVLAQSSEAQPSRPALRPAKSAPPWATRSRTPSPPLPSRPGRRTRRGRGSVPARLSGQARFRPSGHRLRKP